MGGSTGNQGRAGPGRAGPDKPAPDRPAQPDAAYIGLGSNLPSPAGPPRETLMAAVRELARLGEVTSVSSVYETQPVGYRDQPRFLNAAAALRTWLEPLPLLHALLALERRFGRDRGQTPAKGPRTLDLDLLLMDGAVVLASPELTLPHPALAERRFVLAPLAEVAPGLRHPLLHRTMSELLAALPDEGENRRSAVRRVGALAG